MNRENLIKLQDIIARNNCANADEMYVAFESSPERQAFVRGLISQGFVGAWGFVGLCNFLDIDCPAGLDAYNFMTGEAAWLQFTLFRSRRYLTACSDADRPSGKEIRASISAKLDAIP